MASRRPVKAAILEPDDNGVIDSGAIESSLALAFPGLEIVDDSTAIQQGIIDRMMQAESLDELFAQREVMSVDQLVGRTIEFISAEWSTFTTEEGKTLPLGKIIGADVKTKEKLDFIATAPNVTAFIYRAQLLGALPFKARVIDKPTKRGYKTILLDRP